MVGNKSFQVVPIFLVSVVFILVVVDLPMVWFSWLDRMMISGVSLDFHFSSRWLDVVSGIFLGWGLGVLWVGSVKRG